MEEIRTKKLKFNDEILTAYRYPGGFFSKPSLKIKTQSDTIIYCEKSHNQFRLDNLFESDEYLKNILSDLLKPNYKDDEEIHDLDILTN